jgi:hypothetical protein
MSQWDIHRNPNSQLRLRTIWINLLRNTRLDLSFSCLGNHPSARPAEAVLGHIPFPSPKHTMTPPEPVRANPISIPPSPGNHDPLKGYPPRAIHHPNSLFGSVQAHFYLFCGDRPPPPGPYAASHGKGASTPSRRAQRTAAPDPPAAQAAQRTPPLPRGRSSISLPLRPQTHGPGGRAPLTLAFPKCTVFLSRSNPAARSPARR